MEKYAVARRVDPTDYTLDDLRRDMARIHAFTSGSFLSPSPDAATRPADLPVDDAERYARRLQGIIDSMTKEERLRPMEMIDDSRYRRIAAGAAVAPATVKELVTWFPCLGEVMRRILAMWRPFADQPLAYFGMSNRLPRQANDGTYPDDPSPNKP